MPKFYWQQHEDKQWLMVLGEVRLAETLAMTATGAGLALPCEHPLYQALKDYPFASVVPTQLWRPLYPSHLSVNPGSVLSGGYSTDVNRGG